MQDVINSVKAFLYERSSSPLAGAFAIAWLISNYTVVLIAFSGAPLDDKLYEINEYFETIGYVQEHVPLAHVFDIILWKAFLWPLILAILYLFVYPWAAIPTYRFTLNMRKKMNSLRDDFEGSLRLTVERSQEILSNQATLKEDLGKEIERNREQRDAFNNTLADYNEVFGGLEKTREAKEELDRFERTKANADEIREMVAQADEPQEDEAPARTIHE